MDEDSLVYLMLANHILHTLYPTCITIAEVRMPVDHTVCARYVRFGLGGGSLQGVPSGGENACVGVAVVAALRKLAYQILSTIYPAAIITVAELRWTPGRYSRVLRGQGQLTAGLMCNQLTNLIR